jgi:hypothetical protein
MMKRPCLCIPDLQQRSKFERTVVPVNFQIFLRSCHTLLCAYLYPFLFPGLRQKVNSFTISLSFLNTYLPSAFSHFLTYSRICFVIPFCYYLCKLSLDSGWRYAQCVFSNHVLLIHKISQKMFVAGNEYSTWEAQITIHVVCILCSRKCKILE